MIYNANYLYSKLNNLYFCYFGFLLKKYNQSSAESSLKIYPSPISPFTLSQHHWTLIISCTDNYRCLQLTTVAYLTIKFVPLAMLLAYATRWKYSHYCNKFHYGTIDMLNTLWWVSIGFFFLPKSKITCNILLAYYYLMPSRPILWFNYICCSPKSTWNFMHPCVQSG